MTKSLDPALHAPLYAKVDELEQGRTVSVVSPALERDWGQVVVLDGGSVLAGLPYAGAENG